MEFRTLILSTYKKQMLSAQRNGDTHDGGCSLEASRALALQLPLDVLVFDGPVSVDAFDRCDCW